MDPWRTDPQEKIIRDVLDRVWQCQALLTAYYADKGSEELHDRGLEILMELEQLANNALRELHPH